MTGNEYIAIVQNEVDDYSDRAKSIIWGAIKDVHREIFDEVKVLYHVIGSASQEIPITNNIRVATVDFSDMIAVFWKASGETNWKRLEEITLEQYNDEYRNASVGQPSYFYVDGGNIYFERLTETSGTLLVNYVGSVSDMTETAQSTLPDRYSRVLILGAIARFKMYEGVIDYQDYERRYKESLSEMITSLSLKKNFKPTMYGQ